MYIVILGVLLLINSILGMLHTYLCNSTYSLMIFVSSFLVFVYSTLLLILKLSDLRSLIIIPYIIMNIVNLLGIIDIQKDRKKKYDKQKNDIESLLTPVNINEYKEDECSICLDDISYNQLINQNLLNKDYVKIKCDHIFHRECISGWLKKNRTCPICRDEIY